MYTKGYESINDFKGKLNAALALNQYLVRESPVHEIFLKSSLKSDLFPLISYFFSLFLF